MSLRERAVIYLPPTMRGPKRQLVERIGASIGGGVVDSVAAIERLPADAVPIICCAGELAGFLSRWRAEKRAWIYWDRGYVRRLGGWWPALDDGSGYLRWHVNSFQMQALRDVPADRWQNLRVDVAPWRRGGRKIVVATTGPEYARLHGSENWLAQTLATLKTSTDRPILVRDKGSPVPLARELQDAHCLVAHGSNAAVEATILGCPVFVDSSSAAALVGLTDLSKIETPLYPERQPWLNSLAYSQFLEAEIFDGTLWRLIQ